MSINTLSVATQGLRAPNPERPSLTIATLGWRYKEKRVAPVVGPPAFSERPGAGGVPYTPHIIPLRTFVQAAQEIANSFRSIEERRADTSEAEAELASLEIAVAVEGDEDRAKYTAGVIALASKNK